MNTTKQTSKNASKKANKPALHAPVAETQKANVMAFAVQQMTAPVAVEQPVVIDTSIQDTPEFKAALAAALANRVPVAAKSKADKTPRVKRVEQNGIKRPIAGESTCAKIWSTLDAISAEQKSPATIAQLRVAYPCNAATQQTQYAQWRQFNGIVGRIVAPTVQTAPAVETISG